MHPLIVFGKYIVEHENGDLFSPPFLSNVLLDL